MCCIAASAVIAGWRKTPPKDCWPERAYALSARAAPLSRSGSEAAVPRPLPTLLIEIATITARGLAGQPMKRGTEPARVAEADIERNRSDGLLAIRQLLLGPLDSPNRVITVRRHT